MPDQLLHTLSNEQLCERVTDLETAIREMILSLPGGSICDPQEVADALREIAAQHGVKVED